MRHTLILLLFPALLFAQKKPGRAVYTNTKTYPEVITAFQQMDVQSNIDTMLTAGLTDSGLPLHEIILSADRTFDPAMAKTKGKCVIMVNNAIHPGEPDGVDASYELAKTYTQNPKLLPSNVVLVIIPVYNIGGYLNRNSTSRANQNGPEQYGFRGNAKNLDLNRDFIKADAANTWSLEAIFQKWKPDIFIDNHVSDGADYQYTMTLIATQRNKLQPLLSNYMDTKLVPGIYSDMKKIGNPICPYVETYGETPESGIVGFMESPRFATGYAALFNCIGFVTETHMLKPYNDRVWATYDLMIAMINRVSADAGEIIRLHKEADEAARTQTEYVLRWELDTTQFEMFEFMGYASSHVPSKITGLPVLAYDHTKPYTKPVRFYNTYKPKEIVYSEATYIVPQAYTEVIDRLRLNGVEMIRLTKDTILTAGMFTIYGEVSARLYESHYYHANTSMYYTRSGHTFHKGDYAVRTNQACNRYIVETLDPRFEDSFFAWNFFDGILSQKEWFSDYVFETKAEAILAADPQLKADLDKAVAADTGMAKSNWAQMNFIYQHSMYKEPTHNVYPVGLLNTPFEQPAGNKR